MEEVSYTHQTNNIERERESTGIPCTAAFKEKKTDVMKGP